MTEVMRLLEVKKKGMALKTSSYVAEEGGDVAMPIVLPVKGDEFKKNSVL